MKQFQKKTLAIIEQTQEVLENLRVWWPLTLRQIFYRLVVAGAIDNKEQKYRRLSDILSEARMAGLIEWEAMEDRSRRTIDSDGWCGIQPYVETERKHLLRRYRRDLGQGQKVALEAWVEKDALAHLVHQAADPYCVRTVIARGFASTSYMNACRERILANARRGQHTIILYFGDFDPSGWEMPFDLERRLARMGVEDYVTVKRCALNPEQVAKFHLAHNPEQFKPNDPNSRKFLELFGEMAVELDALAPEELQGLVRESIEANLDLEVLEEQRTVELNDLARLEDMRERVEKAIAGVIQ